MTVPWKSWCRLCASPNGGVPIVEPDGSDHFLSEKIRKYLSITVSEEDKIPSLLCSKCCDQLAAFDNFFHHCLQVQAMFCALCELDDHDIADERLHEIRKEFLSTDVEVCRDKSIHSNSSAKHKRRNIVDGKKNSIGHMSKNNNGSKKPSTYERNGQHLESNLGDCRKSKRLKEMAEIKRAFGEVNETFTDTLDTDFNEDSFENLLVSDDSFQPVLRNSKNGLKMRDDFKIIQTSFCTSNMGHGQALMPSKDAKLEKCSNEVKALASAPLQKKEDPAKIRDNELGCDVLSSEANGTSVHSLSDTDINDFICGDNTDDDNDDAEESDTPENNNHSKEYKVNGIWKSPEKDKSLKKPYKISNEQTDKVYEIDRMFEESASEGVCVGHENWITNEMSEEKIDGRKKVKSKDSSLYKCEQCDKAFHRKALLDVHLISHMPKEQQPYVCCKCARRFHCEALLRNHERVHLPNEEKLVFPCHVCHKKFSSRSAVTAHLKAIHFGERPFVCHLCGHSFSSKGILQEHITIHSDEEPWQCTTCSKRFKTKYRLRIHMDTHRETPYSCPHCPIQLSTRRTLRMHLVVHRDTKAYQCTTCGKAFRRAKDLKNHHNLHTGRKPYTCPFCSRTFANGSNCRSHKRRMHPEELRLYEAALAGNGCIDPLANSASLETDSTNNNTLITQQDIDEDDQSMKEDSQDSLLTEMALDLQQPSILSVKSSLANVHDNPVVTAADLTLAPLVTLSSTLPKLEPDDSRLVMNLTTQMHENNDSMDAMSPLNLNIMSPMNLNMSSPLNLNISSPLNLNISSVLHSPTGRNQQQQQNSIQSHHHQNSNRYQPPSHHQTQQQPQHLILQPSQHQPHQQPQLHHQQVSHQTQVHQQMHQQQLPRSTIQMSTLQPTTLSSPSPVHTITTQIQLPAHLNNTVHHAPQNQTFTTLNQQGSSLYGHHTAHTAHVQESVSSATLMAAAAMAHSMASSSTTALPPFGGSPYTQHSMSYGRGANM